MASPDFFGITDRIRQLTAPPGFEGVHEDGFSWARQGTTWNDTTRIGPTEWNMLIGNLRGIGLMPDVVSNEFDPSGPYVLRDALVNFVVVRVDYLIAPYMASINAALELKAPIASPTFTGAPRGPTPAAADYSTRLATTVFVKDRVNEVIGGSVVSGLSTISDLGAAMGQKAPLNSPALTGTPTAPTVIGADDSDKIATTGYVKDRTDEVVVAMASGTLVPAREEVVAAQTSALPAHTYANGTAGVGATITGNANGALATSVFDAISSLAGTPRVWVRLEGAKNGLYVVTQVGSAGTPFILTRATDSDTAAELGACHFSITGGATFGGRHYQCKQLAADITVGTTALTFGLVSDGSALLNEVIAARGAEASLGAAMAAETNSRSAADEALQANIDAVEIKIPPTVTMLARRGITPIAGEPDAGIPVVFLDKEGALNAPKFKEAANPRVVRQGVVGGIEDENGYIAFGVTADGTAALFGEATLPFAYLKADANGTVQVFVDHNNEGRQVTFGELDVIACRAFAPGLVRYVVVDPVDGRTSRIASFDPEVIAPFSLGTASELLGTIGQSNGVGASSDGTEHVYTDENPHPQVLMFEGGIIPREGVDAMTGGPGGTPPVAFAEVDMASLVPAVERFKIVAQSQTHCTSAAVGYLSRGHNFNRRMTVFSAAVGAAAYADIKKTTQPYADFMLAVEKFAEIETAASRVPSMRFVLNRHGESNINALQATYAGYLDEWIADLRTDCAAFIADAATMTMIVDQVGWPNVSSLSAVALAQLERGTTAGTGIVCIGPTYWAPYVSIHMSPLGHRRWGDMAAKFMARLSRGEPARPLYAKAAIRLSATSFLLDYDHDFPIVYDNKLVSDPGGAGVRIVDTGGVIIGCSFDRIIDGRYAKFRMASTPSDTTPIVQIAAHGFNTWPGPTTGLRANIRDTDPYRSPIDGAPLYNWAAHQAFDLPAA